MFPTYEMKSFLVIENVNVVILIIGLLVGLLLGYRYKLKDRSNSTEIKDEEKNKKDKSKSKKIFLKSSKADKQNNANGFRNRKNEPLNESQHDEKMGLLNSKSDSNEKNKQSDELPEAEIGNSSPNNTEKKNHSTLERKFLSDELKPNVTTPVQRQSSIKVLHDSIGSHSYKQKSDVENNNKKDNNDEPIIKKEKPSPSTPVKKPPIKISVSVSKPAEKNEKIDEPSIPTLERPVSPHTKVELTDTLERPVSPHTKKTVSKSPKFDRAGSSISKLVNSLNSNAEVSAKTPDIQPCEIKNDSVAVTSVPSSDKPNKDLKAINDDLNIKADKNASQELKTISLSADHKNENKVTDKTLKLNKALDTDANEKLVLTNDILNKPDINRNSSTTTNVELDIEPEVNVEIINECYNANINLENSLLEIITTSNKIVSDEKDIDNKKDNEDITKKSVLSNKNIENISVTDQHEDFDAIVAANSISSEIWSNVLDDLKVFSKKTVIDSYSDNLADVIINDNNVQHEIIDECDGRTPKTNEEKIDSVKNELDEKSSENKSVNVNKMSVNEIGNFTTNIKNNKNNEKSGGRTKKESKNGSLSPDEIRKPTVVLRRKRGNKNRNNKSSQDKRCSFTGRPVSHFADQLAELLANDDVDFDLDSDEELNNAIEKVKEKYQGFSSEIDKFQRKCSVTELKEYGAKNFKAKVTSRIRDKKTKLKGDRPLSLYEQDLLADLLDEEEFDDSNEVAEDTIESVQSSVQILEDKIPFNLSRNDRSYSNLSNASSEDYDSHDENTRSHIDFKPIMSNGKAQRLGRAAVIDLGSGILKAGMCGDMEPSCYCPSVVGTPRRFSQDVSKMKKGYYVGDEAWTVAGMLSIDYPLNKSDVTNWPDVTRIIEHLLDSELKVNDRLHPIMLTEKGLVSKKHREKLTEIIFETFGIPAYYLANQAPLALYSMGITTGICVNAGFNCTQSTPVYEGHCIPHATVQFDIGGDHVTKQLGRILNSSQGHAFNSSSEKLVLNSMKQSCCYVSTDIPGEEELYKRSADMLQTYTLPDGQEIELGTERFAAPEILFNPQSIGLNKANSAEIIHQSIDLMEDGLQQELKENIVVSGGTSKFTGYGPRLQHELAHSSQTDDKYNLKYTDNPLLATWVGGSVLSSIGSFRDQWITIDQYAEHGSPIVHRLCF